MRQHTTHPPTYIIIIIIHLSTHTQNKIGAAFCTGGVALNHFARTGNTHVASTHMHARTRAHTNTHTHTHTLTGHLSDGKDAANAGVLSGFMALHMMTATCYQGAIAG